MKWSKYEPKQEIDPFAELREVLRAEPGVKYVVEDFELPPGRSNLGVQRRDVALQRALGGGFIVENIDGKYVASFQGRPDLP